MGTDELSQSEPPTGTLQDTSIARSTKTRLSPAHPPGVFHRAVIRSSQAQQSHTPGEPFLTTEISRRVDCINRSLHLYEDDLAQLIDPEHLAFYSLPPPIQHLIRPLCKGKREIMTGAKYIGTELEQMDPSMVRGETATKGLQEALKRVIGRMD